MKLLCLDLDNCGETYFLNDEDYTYFNLNNKFHKCLDCSSLAILVPDDFFLSEEKSLYIKMYFNILSKDNDEN
jgi:hypothetical protein